VSFLEVKNQLLLDYCINVVFFMLLKAEGKQIDNHPAIDRLVKLRVYLEKLRPLDKKMKYQIDKLLRLAALGDRDDEETNDPLKARPNPLNLGSVEDGAEDGANEDEESSKTVPKYKPPKLVAAYYEETDAKSRKAKEEKLLRKANRSELVKELVTEFAPEPEEISHASEKLDEEEREKQEYEETYHVRLVETRQEKKRRRLKQHKLPHQQLDRFGGFADLAAFEHDEEQAAEEEGPPDFRHTPITRKRKKNPKPKADKKRPRSQAS